jgi:hypothetical protein
MHVMTPRESWTDERLDDLNQKVDDGFRWVDARFDKVDARFDKLDARFDKLEARFEKLLFVLLTAAVAIIVALIGFSSAILVAVL